MAVHFAAFTTRFRGRTPVLYTDVVISDVINHIATIKVMAMRVVGVKGLVGNADVLLGMDVIGLGDFAVTESHGKTVMTFRMPHRDVIDFDPPGSAKKDRA